MGSIKIYFFKKGYIGLHWLILGYIGLEQVIGSQVVDGGKKVEVKVCWHDAF